MPFHRLEELRYTQLDAFDRDKTLFLLAVSPVEEHGPHLPLGVDGFNAEYFLNEIAQRFDEKHKGWSLVRIPTLWIGSFLFDAAGSISVRPRTIKNLVIEMLSSLAAHGFRYFLISNAHGGPTHVVALEEAARIVSRRHGVKAISFSGHLIWEFLRGEYWSELRQRLNLTEEDVRELKEDAHAGQWETSMMLMLKPELVDPGYKELKPFVAAMVQRLRPDYPLKMGEKLGYVGHPARAHEELARESSRFLLDKAFEMVERDLQSGKTAPASMFYRFPLFRTEFFRIALAIALLGILILAVFLLLHRS